MAPTSRRSFAKKRARPTSTGGTEIRLPAADQKRFLDESIAADLPILTATPQGKEDYEAFAAAAKKYRR